MRCWLIFGMAMEAITRMMATTIMISINEKPRLARRRGESLGIIVNGSSSLEYDVPVGRSVEPALTTRALEDFADPFTNEFRSPRPLRRPEPGTTSTDARHRPRRFTTSKKEFIA